MMNYKLWILDCGFVAAPACRQAGSEALQRHPDVRWGAATNKIVVSELALKRKYPCL